MVTETGAPFASAARRAAAVGAGGALILAPGCYVVAQLLLLRARPGSELWSAAHIALFAWAFFLVLAVVGLGWYLWSPGPLYALAGGTLVVFGALVDTLFTGIDFVSGVMASSGDTAVMGRLSDAIFAQLVLPLDSLDDALPVGMLVLAIGLYRTRAAPLWATSILLVGLAIPGSELLKLIAGPLQLIGLSWVGWRLARQGGAAPTAPTTAWRPRLAAVLLTVPYLPAAPLAVVRAIMLVLVIVLLTVPEVRQARPALRPATTA